MGAICNQVSNGATCNRISTDGTSNDYFDFAENRNLNTEPLALYCLVTHFLEHRKAGNKHRKNANIIFQEAPS
jgi:hypothetical protein